MPQEPSKCPVTGASSPDKASGCPWNALVVLFQGLRDKVAKVTGDKRGFPIHYGTTNRAQLMRFSIAFSQQLISLIQILPETICHRIDRISQKKNREKILRQIFVNTLDERISNGESISEIVLLELAEKRMSEPDIPNMPNDIANRIINIYQIGIKNIIRIWQQLLRAFEEKYGRLPHTQEMVQMRGFVMDFAHNIGESPSMIANPLSKHVLEKIHLDEQGAPYFDETAVGLMEEDLNDSLTKRTAKLTLALLENSSCPALAEIRNIAEACCKVLEQCYEHALTK